MLLKRLEHLGILVSTGGHGTKPQWGTLRCDVGSTFYRIYVVPQSHHHKHMKLLRHHKGLYHPVYWELHPATILNPGNHWAVFYVYDSVIFQKICFPLLGKTE